MYGDNKMNISKGQIVYSKAGRDKGLVFVVLDVLDNRYVVIADGKLRKIESPKKKKIKHIIMTDIISHDIIDKLNENKISNSYIRNVLKEVEKDMK